MAQGSSIDFVPDPTLYPFESRWFDSPAGAVHYVDEGPRDATPLVFFHGNPTWSFLWRHVITGLREEFRCIAVDMLGFGLSARPVSFSYTAQDHVEVLADLVDHLALDGFVTVGQDWGGPISLGVATRRADRVAGVVLGNTWAWPATPSIAAFGTVMSTAPMQRLITERNLFVEHVMRLIARRRLDDLTWRHYTAVQPDPTSRRGVAELPKELTAARPLLEQIRRDVPTLLGSKRALVLWGRRDPGFLRPLVLPRLTRQFSDCEVVELPGAGHFFPQDSPLATAEAIAARFR